MTPAAAPDLADLKRRSVRGGAVTLAARLASVLLTLASTMVLARLLAPQDFGLLAMLLSVTAFVGVFRDFGLSSAAVQQGARLTAAEASSLFWLNVAAGAVLTVLVAALAPCVGWLFDAPALVPATQAMALSLLVGSLGHQHAAALQSALQLRRKAVADIAGALASFLLVVALALHGYGFWALVWGTVAGAAVTSGLLLALSPLRLTRPARGPGLRQLLRFGGHVTAFECLNYFHRHLDNILIGRVWGADALGLYSRAYQLLMFPITNLRAPINTVAFAAMSRLRDQPELFRAYYCKVSFVLALSSMPLVAFLAVAAEEVMAVLLGPRWQGAVPIFQALALAAFIQPVASLRGLVALSSGRSRDYLVLGAVNAVVVCTAFVIGLRWGAMGVAIGYSLAIYLLLVPTVRLSFRRTSIRMADFWAAIAQPAATSLAAAAVVLGLLQPAVGALPLALALAIKAAGFAAAWLLAHALWPGGWHRLRQVRALLRELR